MSRARFRAIVRQFAENGMKLLLEDPRNVRELLATQRLKLIDHIDFDRAKRVRATFVQRDYRHKRRLAGQITVYILIEHQSEPDALMVFRGLEYVVQIYKAQVRSWRRKQGSLKGLRLQPVLPVVFYTAARSWDGLGRMADFIELGDVFGAMIPEVAPLFLNLATVPAVRLEEGFLAGSCGWCSNAGPALPSFGTCWGKPCNIWKRCRSRTGIVGWSYFPISRP